MSRAEQPLSGEGSVRIGAGPAAVWAALLDPAVLAALIPGADVVERHAPGAYRATLSFGVGRMRGRYATGLELTNQEPPRALDLAGRSKGRLGEGWAKAHVVLVGEEPGPTTITWRYEGGVSGMVAYAGRPVLQMAGHLFVDRFFRGLTGHLSPVR